MTRTPIRLLSTDFDGTLVDHESDTPVVPEWFTILRKLRTQGAVWAVNTGRALHHIVEGLEHFAFPEKPDYVLTSEREVFRPTADGAGWEDFGDWNLRCNQAHDEMFEVARPLLDEIIAYIGRETQARFIDDTTGIGVVASSDAELDRILAFVETIRARVPDFHYHRNTVYVRFCHAAYSKGAALGELQRLLGIDPAHTFAVGDHLNDLPMLDGTFARMPACPGNSVDEVKAAVRRAGGYVASAKCSIGVVEALEFFTKNAAATVQQR
jgi:hypothetical protein